MLDMNLPWWEFVVRGAAVYAVLLVMVRLSGKRTVGQFTPFDLLVVMLLSESVSNALTGGDDSLAGGLIAAATLIVLNFAIAFFTSHSTAIEKAVEGSPVLLGRDGKIFDQVLKANRVGKADLQKALREAQAKLEDTHLIFLEIDGSISVMQKKKSA